MSNVLFNLHRSPARWSGALALLLWVGTAAWSQPLAARLAPTEVPANTAAAAPTQDLGQSIKEWEARLAEARDKLTEMGEAGGTNAPAGVAAEEVWVRRAVLHRLVLLYEQQIGNAAALEKARARRDEATREAQAWSRFPEPPPYSILLGDRLQEEVQTARQKITSGEAAMSALSQLIEDNRQLLAQAEGNIRKLNEQLEIEREPAATARLAWQRDLENLRSQVAAVSMAAFDQQLSVNREDVATSHIRLGLLQRQLIIAQAGTTFTRAELDQAISRIQQNTKRLERELDEALGRQLRARQNLDEARQAQTRSEAANEPAPARALARELVSVREAELKAVDTTIYVLRVMLEGDSVERTMWEFRFAAYHGRKFEALRDSRQRLSTFTRRLVLWRDTAGQQVDSVASDLRLQEARLAELPAGSDLEPLGRERLNALREEETVLLRLAQGLGNLVRLTERWAESLREAEARLPLGDRVRNLFSGTRSFLEQLWSLEVFTAEDTITVDGQKITGKRSVTIGKIVMAILIVVVGYWITGLLTALLESIIVKRVKMEPNQANLIRRWLRAALLACLLVFSLVSVKIPLTVFAFAGGALAIGLGFGTQTMLKNFVSGLILLFERPFRVGDVLDVGGQKGTVTSIGLRASVLQLWDGTETLIPNSSLLENNVTNWTYSNRKVRFAVGVGAAYGSDPRKVIKLLEEVAARHGLVEKDPKPLVLFTEFGDSTLNFELRFWLDVGKTNSAQVCSDLRLMIASAFGEHGIVVDYPQRDVHLHAPVPLDVRIIPSDAPGGAAPLPAGQIDAGETSRPLP